MQNNPSRSVTGTDVTRGEHRQHWIQYYIFIQFNDSQCLPINFNIFNDKKYCVAWQLQQYIGRKYDFYNAYVSMHILHW